jgi:hypothetical protein
MSQHSRWKRLIATGTARRCVPALVRHRYRFLAVTAVVLAVAACVALAPRGLADAATVHASNAAAAPYNFGSGYSAIDASFTSASASWTEPTATCAGGNQATGFWVGLSGAGTIAQTGTAANCDGTTPVYYSWWEMYPAVANVLSNPTEPGDNMTASVAYEGNNNFQFTLADSTQGWTVTENGTQAATGGTPISANYIVEANQDHGSGAGNTTDFGSVTFTQCAANGAALSNFSLWTGNLRDANNVQEDTVSPLSDGGTSFTATWDSTG